MPKITYQQFKKDLQSGNFNKLYYLNGEEKYLVEHFEKTLAEKIVGKNHSDFDFMMFEGKTLKLDDLAAALETFPVVSSKKCVIIRNLDVEAIENVVGFIEIISDIPDSSILIISHRASSNAPKKTAKFKKIENVITKAGIIVNFSYKDVPIEKQLILWSKKEYGKILSPENAGLIIKKCANQDFTNIKNELKKICEFETNEIITEKSINTTISAAKADTTAFELCKSIRTGNTKAAFKQLETLLEKREEPIAILAAISSDYIDMYRIKTALQNGKTASDVSGIFNYKNKEFRLKIAESAAKNLKTEDIKKYLDILIQADLKLKTTKIDPKLILSRLILDLIKQ